MLHYLLNFWLSSIVMMFAAGAVVDAGAMGGGDAGGDGGAGGDGAGDDADAGGTDDFGGDGGAGGDGAGDDADAEQDGADNPDAAAGADQNAASLKGFTPEEKKLLALAQKAGPKEAQRVRQLLFAEKRLNKILPGGVKAVSELVRSLNEVGGFEGIQELQSKVEAEAEETAMYDRGDPKWVELGFEENPDNALKMFQHSLAYVADKFPEQAAHIGAGWMLNQLGHRKNGLAVHDLHRFLASIKDSPEAKAFASQLANFYNVISDSAENAPVKKVDDAAKALSAREAEVGKKEMDLRYSQLNTEILPVMRSTVTKTLRAEAKTSGLDLDKLAKDYPAEWRSMLSEIHETVRKTIVKDRRFVNNYAGLITKGQIRRAAQLANSKHEAVIPAIARQVMKTYGVFRGKRTNPVTDRNNPGAGANAGNNNAGNSGWTRVSAKPANHLIDYKKTSQAMQLDGQYILNDGKKVIVKY